MSAVLRTANLAYHHVRHMAELDHNELRVLCIGSDYKLLHEEVITTESVSPETIKPIDVFRIALEHKAVAVIIAHNHTSGSLEPTHADYEVTARLWRGGQLLGIEVLDHLIVAGESYMSIIGKDYEDVELAE